VSLGFFYFVLINSYQDQKPETADLVVTRMLTVFAAIYFMIWAIENVGVGLQGSKFEKRWDDLFKGTN
jgi:hypothetical protein